MFNSRTIKELKIGDSETLTMTIEEENIEAFARATGDFNPIHMDQEYAESTPFGKRVVHGVLLNGIVSGLLGTKLPGLGTVAREITSKFSRPILMGDTVTVTAEVADIREKYNICTLKYNVRNQEGKIAVKGEAVVLPKQEE
ncbi:MaoC family dehydratase [Elusimicrobiota bacterium]